MEKNHPHLDLNGLGGDVRKYVQWSDIRTVGVVKFGDNMAHVVDTNDRALVVTYRDGMASRPYFLIKSFDEIMVRLGRLVEGRPLLSGRLQ